jgi:hypothetical protein
MAELVAIDPMGARAIRSLLNNMGPGTCLQIRVTHVRVAELLGRLFAIRTAEVRIQRDAEAAARRRRKDP